MALTGPVERAARALSKISGAVVDIDAPRVELASCYSLCFPQMNLGLSRSCAHVLLSQSAFIQRKHEWCMS
jgi:hypothetical protein